jgi:hypothetical protein
MLKPHRGTKNHRFSLKDGNILTKKQNPEDGETSKQKAYSLNEKEQHP